MSPSRRSLPRPVLAFVSVFLPALVLVACVHAQTSSPSDDRPACVTLPVYGSVIQQVMEEYPDWAPQQDERWGYSTKWVIQRGRGAHELFVALTPQECVCATRASSRFIGSLPSGELAGFLQGAAVAPVSDLDYLDKWIEPKLWLHCSRAFLFRDLYQATEVMADGTTWELVCRRAGMSPSDELDISLTVRSQQCADVVK